MQNDTDLLFPPRIIPALRDLRGEGWQALVKKVEETDPDAFEHLAFILMMVRLNGCPNCNADSFRSLQGCTRCSKQSLRRFHGTDDELNQQYLSAYSEIKQTLERRNNE